MKTTISILLFATFLLNYPVLQAQNLERFPKMHERILQAKLREIKMELKLDKAKFEEFRPIYLKYDHEISRVNFRDLARLNKVDSDSLSTEEADRMIASQIEAAKKMLFVREKYSKEFRVVLTPQQIIKLYQTEAGLRKKVMQEIKRRLKGR